MSDDQEGFHVIQRTSSWGKQRRMQSIDFRVRQEGRLNRSGLSEYFGVSTPQASLDIAKRVDLAPTNLFDGRSSKTYGASQDFKALFARSSAQRYLVELLAKSAGIVDPSASYIGTTRR